MLEVSIIIFIFSVIQSLVGVGLLVFGTPTLLMLGYSFNETLSIVLPPSIAISLLQVLGSNSRSNQKFMKNFICFSVPSLIVGFVLVMGNEVTIDLKKIVGVMLLVSGMLRLSNKFGLIISGIIKKQNRLSLLTLGFVHGISNMGGGLLTLYASSLSTTKSGIRSTVAFAYLIWGILQYSLLVLSDNHSLDMKTLFLPLISIVTYRFIGQHLFKIATEKTYHKVVTALLFSYGISLLV